MPYKETAMKPQEQGFTLIELVMVIVILGILSAIALPRFVDLQTDALLAAKRGMSGAVKSAHAIAIADLKDFPTLNELVTYVQGEGVAVAAGGDGIDVDINGVTHTVPTYTDTTCSPLNATADGANTVRCVGTIP
jgi:MSHA pilin protein MshA